jgi:hypothetical protein
LIRKRVFWIRIGIYFNFLLITSFTLSPFAAAQITFEKTFGGASFDEGYSVQQTTDGGYIIGGNTYSFGNGESDVYLVRTDSLGNLLWSKTFGGDSLDGAYSVQQTLDGGFIIAGRTASFGAGFEDVYLIKTNSLGDSLWTKTIGDSFPDLGYSLQETSDGGYIITGTTVSINNFADVYLIKTDSFGDTLWTKTYGDTLEEQGYSVQQTTDGGYIITGWIGPNLFGPYDVYLVKTDSSGTLLWTKTYGEMLSFEFGRSIQQTSDGGYFIVGRTSLGGPNKVYAIKTDSLGDSLWTKTYGGGSSSSGYSCKQTSDSGYVIVGYSNQTGVDDVFVIKTDSAGDTLWTRLIGGSDFDGGYSVQETFDGGYIIAGRTESYGAGSSDIYLIKTDGNGEVGLEEKVRSKAIVKNVKLFQNYPNPFSHSTSIRYIISEVKDQYFANSKERNVPVHLAVYDISGKLVKILVQENQEPGSYQITWEGNNQQSKRQVPNGVYYYNIQIGEFSESKKLILIR